ncbi:MAG: glycogen debranching protein GlgX [Pseudomonadota bacterium]
MIELGDPTRLGATARAGGVNFALFSETASDVELCLFDSSGGETQRLRLPGQHNGVWHGFVPGLQAGQRYGYRVHGEWQPQGGAWFNPHKLLIDPYARLLTGDFTWHSALFALAPDSVGKDTPAMDTRDSAPYLPRSVVTEASTPIAKRPLRRWRDTVIYETNVRGYTMRHPALNDAERGKFAGLSNGAIVDALRSLGITAIELLPVHAFVDEQFLGDKGLANAWGYNTLNFFAPMNRYAGDAPLDEFRHMVQALHDANIEVILDVVYNHTAEGGYGGPNLSFRGIDNMSYYRVMPEQRGAYINDTGTGNTINADHPAVQQLVVDSLKYWARDMGVDGFRFDLAPILGRKFTGFNTDHPLLHKITTDGVLRHCKLIAEPWDIGPGGYQLGQFPPTWSEWNDRYRDALRQYWRGDDRQAPALARRLHGSADIFEAGQREPRASVNFITSHDGFTLRDLVSYSKPHNLANGEDNRDGHQHNYSDNHGAEGPTTDRDINAIRARQQRNLLAALLFSQGTPMLLAGDEIGHTQHGNNNAYAQDNDTTWIDWEHADLDLREDVQRLLELRAQTPLLRQSRYRHGQTTNAKGLRSIEWLAPSGSELHGLDWHHVRAMTLLLVATDEDDTAPHAAIALVMNPTEHTKTFTLPVVADSGQWHIAYHSTSSAPEFAKTELTLPDKALTLLRWH